MMAPTVLFLYDDISQLRVNALSYYWTASQVGFRSIAADWRGINVDSQGVLFQKGYEALSCGTPRKLDPRETIQPDLIIHRHPVWGQSEAVMARLINKYPGALCSYHPHWRTIGDKWITETCMRKADRRGVHISRPRTYLFTKKEMRDRLTEIGRSKPLIFKPTSTSECIGILLSLPQAFDGVLHNVMHSTWPKFVVQDLIIDTAIYKAKKFDLRVYVMVLSFNPLRYRMFHEGVARIAAEPFAPSTIAEPLCVLTGNSYRTRLGYPPHNLLITDVLDYLRKEGANVSNFWTDVDFLVKNVLSAYAEYRPLAKERDLRGRFYFTGMDLLMVPKGATFELLFLETNYVPQLTGWGNLSLESVHYQWLEGLFSTVQERIAAGDGH
jgi:hypothetical protein